MMSKMNYEKTEIKLISFSTTDVITTSSGNNIDKDDGKNDGEWM